MCQEYISKDQLLKNLGQNIKRIRLAQNVSQEELAFRINSARNFVGCIERAEKSPTIVTLSRISYALNVKLSDLVDGIDCA